MSQSDRHLAENPKIEDYCENVHIFEYVKAVNETSFAWKERDTTPLKLCQSSEPVLCRIAFLETPPRKRKEYAYREELTQALGIPEDFWSELYQEANGYFGAYERRDDHGALVGFDTDFRFLCKCNKQKSKAPFQEHSGIHYVWEKMGFFTSWRQDGGLLMLCFDLPEKLQKRLIVRAKRISRDVGCAPFFAHHLALAVVVEDYEDAVWQWRDILRDVEQRRPKLHELVESKTDYIKMHELARHTIHSTENLASAIETTSIMLDALRRLDSTRSSIDSQWSSGTLEHEVTRQLSMLKTLRNRSAALETRLKSEISLVFHMNGQQDSKVAADIAKLSREDSEVSKTIAFLGLLFLPGTLVSAIFSTSFFDFSAGDGDTPGKWTVSDKFWIYWVVTACLTVVTLVTWSVWRRGWRLQTIIDLLKNRQQSPNETLPLRHHSTEA